MLAAQELDKHRNAPLRDLLSLQAKRNRSGKTRRGALLSYKDSAFKKPCDSGQDDALLNQMRVSMYTHTARPCLLLMPHCYVDDGGSL